MALARPGIGFWPLFFVGSIWGIATCYRAASVGRAAALGLVVGTVTFAGVASGALSWGPEVGVALTLLGAAGWGLPLGVAAYLAPRFLSPSWTFLGTAAFWCLMLEAADLVGLPMKVFAQQVMEFLPSMFWGARLVGVNVVSAVLVAALVTGTSGWVLAGSRRERLAALVPAGTGLLIVALLALLGRVTAPHTSHDVSVGILQLNVPSVYYPHRHGLPRATAAIEQELERQAHELRDTQILAFPETLDGRYPLMLPQERARWMARSQELDQAVLLTSYLVEADGRRSNAAGAIAEDGRLVGIHRKVDLAPFGESELAPGQDYQVRPLGHGVRAGVLICQEALLRAGPHALAQAGANLLFALTSDASFLSTPLPFEHMNAVRARAIETGRSIVWASNAGPSGLITRWGEMGVRSSFRAVEPVALRAPIHPEVTPFSRAPWLWPLLAILVLGGALLGERKARPSPAATPNTTPLRGAVYLGAAIVAGALVTGMTPAMVELRQRLAPHPMEAALEVWLGPGPIVSPDPLGRFRVTKDRTAQGALAYFLSYYGPETSPASIELDGAPSMKRLRDYLQDRHQLKTRAIRLNPEALPLVATLVRFKEAGFGVLAAAGGEIVVFNPKTLRRERLAASDLESLLEPIGFIPSHHNAPR